MDKINLNKRVYSKPQYEKVIDTKFSQLVAPVSTTNVSNISNIASTTDISIDQFFSYYNQLFYQIPKIGETNSHEYLVKKSSEYIGSTVILDDIQALIEEINSLQQQNLELNQQLLIASQISSSQQI